MGKTLEQIAQQLRDCPKKVQLIYAFNGTGKTRLSRTFKELVAPKDEGEDDETQARDKILYYNAFTEDLFSWTKDPMGDPALTLRIQPNTFTDWILTDQGKGPRIIDLFQSYTKTKITPYFNDGKEIYFDTQGRPSPKKPNSEIQFLLERGDNQPSHPLKISKGEESNFIWSVFYALIETVISTRSVVDPEDRDTSDFDQLEYIFIDDPVSSLDDNHLMDLALSLAELMKKAPDDLKFIVTTHNVAFYNHLHGSLKSPLGYLLDAHPDGFYELREKKGAANTAFAYHLNLKEKIERAIAENALERSHFTDLRNLYEKTASFLGHEHWSDLLPKDAHEQYQKRIIHFSSHSAIPGEEPPEPKPHERQIIKQLLDHLTTNYRFSPDDLPYAPTNHPHR